MNRIFGIFAVIGFALFFAGCPASPTQNSRNNSNQTSANISNEVQQCGGSTGCNCNGKCQPCNAACDVPPTPRPNANANTNANVR